MSCSYHIHFGAGKLGLGFVMPIIHELGVPIAVFQRPGSQEWSKLVADQDIHLTVNNNSLFRCKYITDKCSLSDVEKHLANKENLFVSTCNIDVLRSILREARSFTTAVAAGGMDDVFAGLSLLSSYPQICVYTFENDFKAVEEFRKKVGESIAGLTVISVMCDRICTSREISSSSEVNRVNTVTEEFAGCAVVFSSQHPCCPPFTSHKANRKRCLPSNVILATTPGEETFFYNRKFSLLNGIHYTMAVFAYASLLKKGIPPNEWMDKPLVEWRSTENINDLNTLIDARIVHLIQRTDKQTLLSVYKTENVQEIYKELKSFSDVIMKRIASTNDSTGRILNLKSSAAMCTKYTQHFLPLTTFLHDVDCVEFTDFSSHSHQQRLTAITKLDWKLRSISSAQSIELPDHPYLPLPSIVDQFMDVEEEKKDASMATVPPPSPLLAIPVLASGGGQM